MAAKQSAFGMAHSTVVPRNYRPNGEAADGTDGSGDAGET